MIAPAAMLTALLALTPMSPPDSIILPLQADTLFEVEVVIFPPAGVRLPVAYDVDWGDGSTTGWSDQILSATDISRYHRFARTGEFVVRARVRDSAGNASQWGAGRSIKVGPPLLKWRFATEEAVVAAPSLDLHGNIYFGDETGNFFSVAPTGSLRWTAHAKDAIFAAALVSGNLLYVASADSHLYCLDTIGRQRWAASVGDEVYATPALGPTGTIYVTTDKGSLVAVTPQGKVAWRVQTGDEIAASPTVGHDGLVYATSDSVYCFDPKGRRRWAFGTPDGEYFFAAAVPDVDGQVLVGNTDGYLYCIGPDGRLRWRSPVPDADEIRPEVVVAPDGSFYFGSDGYYVCRKRPAGTPEVVYEAMDVVVGTAAVSDRGTIYVLPDDGTFYAFTAAGHVLWSREIAGGDKDTYYSPAPAIAPDGTVYVTSWDGGLYAFQGDGPPASTLWPQYRHDAQRTGRVVKPKRGR
jgi:outer membrane protein assembly factor BamB